MPSALPKRMALPLSPTALGRQAPHVVEAQGHVIGHLVQDGDALVLELVQGQGAAFGVDAARRRQQGVEFRLAVGLGVFDRVAEAGDEAGGDIGCRSGRCAWPG